LPLVAAHLGHLGRVVCDGAHAFAPWLHLVEEAGAKPVVRANPTHRNARPYDRAADRRRHRAVTTRYDKTAASFSGGLYLAAAFNWLSDGP
jgi:transposase